MALGRHSGTCFGRRAASFFGALSVTLLFVALRFLVTPLRIKVITSILSPADYGLVTLLSMTAHGLSLIVSVGGFELFLRSLPTLSPKARLGLFRAVFQVSIAGALPACALMLGAWRLSVMSGGVLGSLSAGSGIVLFLLFLLLQQRIYYLLGSHEHARARAMQLLWSDFWFLPVLLLPAFISRNAENVVWTWSAWLVAVLVATRRWIPSAWMNRGSCECMSLRQTLRRSMPILPVVVGDWVFRLTGHYALVFYSDAGTLAFYSLAMNLALTGQVAGIPLVDLCSVALGKIVRPPGADWPNAAESQVFTRAMRHIAAVSLPVSLALVFLSDDILVVLAGPSFQAATLLLPWAAALPSLWLLQLFLARVLMLRGQSSCVASGSIGGAILAVVLCGALVPGHGARGAFLAISAASASVNLLFAVRLRFWRWMDVRRARWLSLPAGSLLLALLHWQAGRLIQGPALIRLLAVGVFSLLILAGSGWVRRRDFIEE